MQVIVIQCQGKEKEYLRGRGIHTLELKFIHMLNACPSEDVPVPLAYLDGYESLVRSGDIFYRSCNVAV
jgi:hypothetical protein